MQSARQTGCRTGHPCPAVRHRLLAEGSCGAGEWAEQGRDIIAGEAEETKRECREGSTGVEAEQGCEQGCALLVKQVVKQAICAQQYDVALLQREAAVPGRQSRGDVRLEAVWCKCREEQSAGEIPVQGCEQWGESSQCVRLKAPLG